MNLTRAGEVRCRLSVILALLCCCLVHAAPDDDRVTGLNEQIRTLETLVADTKDQAGKPRLEEKLQRLRQELKILQDRAALEKKQRALQASHPATTLDQLREWLRNIDVIGADESEARLRELAGLRKHSARERDLLVSQLSTLRSDVNAAPGRIVEIEERIATEGEELRALALEREEVEAAMDLAREVEALRERVKSADITADRPNGRAWFDSYTRARAERKAGGQLALERQNLADKLQVSQDSLDVSRQKRLKFDEELAPLEKQINFIRRDPRVERLLAQQREQKATLDARLPLLGRQVDAIKRTEQTMRTRQEQAAIKATFEEENHQRTRSAYLRRLRWPAIVLGGVFALHLIGSYLLLPVFLKNESLFLARRCTRYLAILLGVGVVAGFLFDDLSMIVATLGIVSAAIVISLQDVCTSMFAWLVIMTGEKFRIGDRVEIDGTRGDVIDIQLLRTTLLEVNGWLGVDDPTGRVVLVPNNVILKTKVFNYSHGHPFIWGKLEVNIAYTTPIASALTLFQRILDEETHESFEAARAAAAKMQRRYGVGDAVYKPDIQTQITDNGFRLSLFFVSHYREFPAARNRLNRRIIAELETHQHIQLSVAQIQIVPNVAATAPAAVLGANETTPPFYRPGPSSN